MCFNAIIVLCGGWQSKSLYVCLRGNDENVTRSAGGTGWKTEKTSSPPVRRATSQFPPFPPRSAHENVVFMLEPCIFIYVGFFPLLLFGIPFKCFWREENKKRSDFIDFSFALAMRNVVRGGNCYGFFLLVRGILLCIFWDFLRLFMLVFMSLFSSLNEHFRWGESHFRLKLFFKPWSWSKPFWNPIQNRFHYLTSPFLEMKLFRAFSTCTFLPTRFTVCKLLFAYISFRSW